MAAWAAAIWATLLTACGGGGGTEELVLRRQPLPQVVEDVVSSGPRTDVSNKQFFAAAPGDRAEYRAMDRMGQPVVVVREVSSGPDANGRFTVRESVPGRPEIQVSVEEFQLRAEGLVSLDFWGPDSPPGLRAMVGDLLLYPTPFYPAGSVRSVVRQGDLGADLDGDKVNESFRFEFRQEFAGFETGTRAGRAEQRARFRNRITLRIEPSRAESRIVDSEFTEEVLFAEHTGIISAPFTAVVGGSNEAAYNGLQSLIGGTLNGRDIQTAWNGGRARYLQLHHYDVAYDPVTASYYAGTSMNDPTLPGRVVRIDPTSGQMTSSAALGADVRSIAVAADGRSLYAGLYLQPEVLRLSLPDLKVVQRIPLQADTWAFSLAASPVDASSFSYARAGDVIRLVRNGVHQVRWAPLGLDVTNRPATFSADGSRLYMFGRSVFGNEGLVAMPVMSDGLGAPSPQVPVLSRSLSRGPDGIVAGTGLYDSSTLALLRQVSLPDLVDCRPLSHGARWVCRAGPGTFRLAVVDAANLALVNDGLLPFPGSPLGSPERVIPGPHGQVAVMMGSPFEATALALFNNPDFERPGP